MALSEITEALERRRDGERPRNRAAVSAVAELFWGVRTLHRLHGDVPAHLELDRNRARKLAERIRSFWDDGMQCFTELFVLAAVGGHLEDNTADAFLERLPALCTMPLPERMLATEDPPDRLRVEARLHRLATDAQLRAAYSRLLTTVWAAQSPAWRREGRSIVRRAAADWQAQIDRGAALPVGAYVSESAGCSAEIVVMARDAAADGRLVVAPTYFGCGYCIVDAGPVTILSSPGERGAGGGRSLRLAARDAAARYKALSDPTRLAILALLRAEPLTVGEVARRLEVSQPTVSAHFASLRNAGLLHEQQHARRTQYVLDASRLDAILGEVRTLVLDRRD